MLPLICKKMTFYLPRLALLQTVDAWFGNIHGSGSLMILKFRWDYSLLHADMTFLIFAEHIDRWQGNQLKMVDGLSCQI
jgi:hypothetical protein